MKKLLQGVLMVLGFLLATCNGKSERLLKNGSLADWLSQNLGYDHDLGHKNLIFLGLEKEKPDNLDNNENLAELILKKSGYNDLKHKKNLIVVVDAKEKANADSNYGNLAEVLLKKSGYHKDLEQKKKHVNKEKPNTISNIIKPVNIIILKDNAIYIYNQESGGFIGRSIGSFLSKMLSTFGMNDRGGLLSVDLNSINLVHEPLINNTFPGIVLGENINKIKF